MAWMSQYLVWVTLVSTSAYKCKYFDNKKGAEVYADEGIPKTLDTQHRVEVNPKNHDRVYAQTTEQYTDHATLKKINTNDAVNTTMLIGFGNHHANTPVNYNVNLARRNPTTATNSEETSSESDDENSDETGQFGEVGLRANVQGNERSLPVSSGIQQVYEEGKSSLDGKIKGESLPRVANGSFGSYKIVNIPKTFFNVGSRRGAQDEKRSVTSRTPSRDNVVFPGPTSKSPYLLAPEVPEECIRTGICSEVPNYPEDLVDKIVQKLGDATNKFRVDEFVPEIAQRLGPVDNFIELCNYREDLVVPRAAQDRDGKWHFILNPKKSPLQGYRVEICQGKSLPCSTDIAYFNQGYEGICHQKYVERFMTGLDDKGQMIEKPFKVPSCCSCVVRSLKDKFDE